MPTNSHLIGTPAYEGQIINICTIASSLRTVTDRHLPPTSPLELPLASYQKQYSTHSKWLDGRCKSVSSRNRIWWLRLDEAARSGWEASGWRDFWWGSHRIYEGCPHDCCQLPSLAGREAANVSLRYADGMALSVRGYTLDRHSPSVSVTFRFVMALSIFAVMLLVDTPRLPNLADFYYSNLFICSISLQTILRLPHSHKATPVGQCYLEEHKNDKYYILRDDTSD